jgi:hypothetical protein
MSQFNHLHPNVRTLVVSSATERTQWVKRMRWIGYTRANSAIDKLEDLLAHPRESRMPGMLLVGRSNNGKTRILKTFAERHPPDDNTKGPHILAPVLYVQAPPVPSEAGFYSEILTTLFENVPASSTDAKRAEVIRVLRGIRVKVLIVDELHNLLAGTSVKQQQFLNVIKYLANELEISIVGGGTADLLRAVSIDPQIQNRFTPTLLPKWEMGDEYRKLLASFEQVLPLQHPSKLSSTELARKILAMSEGLIGEISALLNAASAYALSRGGEKIDIDVLNDCGFIAPSDRAADAARL